MRKTLKEITNVKKIFIKSHAKEQFLTRYQEQYGKTPIFYISFIHNMLKESYEMIYNNENWKGRDDSTYKQFYYKSDDGFHWVFILAESVDRQTKELRYTMVTCYIDKNCIPVL